VAENNKIRLATNI